MQPYFLPYIGYFQLINSVDKFVVYDDVSYIKGGWINRNYILSNGKKLLVTLPLSDASSFVTIDKTEIDKENLPHWLKKFGKTLAMSYQKAPFYETVSSMLLSCLHGRYNSISEINVSLLSAICQYLQVGTEIVPHSERYVNNSLRGQDRVIDICVKEKADVYINSIGGRALYDKESFAHRSIMLLFLNPKGIRYQQHKNEFVESLSIVDVLMFNSREKVQEYLNEYELS